MTNTGTTCQDCDNTLTEQDLADIKPGDPMLCEDCYWKTQISPTDYTVFEVTWKDSPESTRSASFTDPADVFKQLDVLATSTVAYTQQHQDEIRIVESRGPAKIAEYAPDEFRAR